jgi:hypothetical protein
MMLDASQVGLWSISDAKTKAERNEGTRQRKNREQAHHLRPYVALPIQLHLSQFHLNPVHHLE